MTLSFRPSRREVLCRIGDGFGALGLASLFAEAGLLSCARGEEQPADRTLNPLAPKASHFAPRARRVIFLFMNGGPSHVDTFDPKPMLVKHAGEPVPPSIAVNTGRKGAGKLMASPFKTCKFGQSVRVSSARVTNRPRTRRSSSIT